MGIVASRLSGHSARHPSRAEVPFLLGFSGSYQDLIGETAWVLTYLWLPKVEGNSLSKNVKSPPEAIGRVTRFKCPPDGEPFKGREAWFCLSVSWHLTHIHKGLWH